MTKSKPQNFIPVPGEKMLEAIGAVAVKWSALEFFIDNMLYWALSPSDGRLSYYMNEASTRQRWDRLKEALVADHKDHPGTSKLVSLVNTALDIKGERDKIVHGIYSDPPPSRSGVEAMIFTLKSHKSRPEWPVTRLRILEAADKIDQLLGSLTSHMLDHGEQIGNSIHPNAWRHADHR